MDYYNQSSSFPYNGDYYNQIPYESGYYDHSSYSYSYYPPSQSSTGFYSYEYVPTQSLIAYSAYSNPCSIQYSVFHSVAAPLLDDDLNFPEYDPHPYRGGYDMDQTYGKPLPPSDEICYPPSSIALSLPTPAPVVPVVPVVQKQEEPEQEEEEDDDDDNDDDDDEEEELPKEEEAEDLRIEGRETKEEGESDESDEEIEDSVQVYEEKDYGRVVDQLPPGYGLEAYDLCENLFGYWPCLSRMKRKKKCGECGNEIAAGVGEDDVNEWKRTADYLFGNPDPYRGWTDEGGIRVEIWFMAMIKGSM